ncbi:AI-2E family transporter [Flavobacterium humi]|uniref:AI-2E family transporter n=1 Tax=Flavobacterium humi TaxID=2562683 RepID=A0A4Z0LCY9_9FLAO|nr:AI-2E family transporter [Flavobacterium humi]TGD59737.1 AI-2E family transporter [Flavobacterium humi]
MTSKIIANGIVRAVLILAGIALVLLFIFQIRAAIAYVIIALVLSLVGNPIVRFLKHRLKFKDTLAAITTLALFFLIIIGFVLMFVPLLISQGENLSLLNTAQMEADYSALSIKIADYLGLHDFDLKQLFEKSGINSKAGINLLSGFLNSCVNTLSSVGVGIASVFFITFFLLKDKKKFNTVFKWILPDAHEDKILASLDKTNHLLSRYFIGIMLQLFIVFLLYLIVLLIFGVQNAFIIAFLCGLLNIIPYIGPLIGTCLAVVLTMIGNLGGDFVSETLPTTLYVMIGFFVVQLIDNNFSQPIIFSNSVKSHPLEIFLIILIGGYLFGIVGMIFAVPAYTVLKVAGKEFLPENKIVQLLTKDI